MSSYKQVFMLLFLLLSGCGGGSGSGGSGGGDNPDSGPGPGPAPGPGAILKSISLIASNTVIPSGQTSEVTATGHYDDGSAQDVTQVVRWQSTIPGILSVNNMGVVTAESVGTATISAELGSISVQQLFTAKGTISLAATGQTRCYDALGNELDTYNCTLSRQDGGVQAGETVNARFAYLPSPASDCVKDRLTGLTWPLDADPNGGYLTWSEGFDYINQLNNTGYCGYSDWRMPNVVELQSLIDNTVVDSGLRWLTAIGFKNVVGPPFWTSTTVADPDRTYAAFIFFVYGDMSTASKTNAAQVWPVRGGI